MKRTTIFIPEVLETDLQHFARRVGKPVAWVMREAVAEYLSSRATQSGLPSSVGLGESGRRDVSERVEELAFADLASTPGAALRARRATGVRKKTRRK